MIKRIVAVVFCFAVTSGTARGQEVVRWDDPHGSATAASLSEALDLFAKHGLPQEAKDKLLKAGSTGGNIQRGAQCEAMVYLEEKKVAKDVITDWHNHALLFTEDRWTAGWMVRRVYIDPQSSNITAAWLLCRIKPASAAVARATPTPSPAPAAVRPIPAPSPPPAPRAGAGVIIPLPPPPAAAATALTPPPAAGQGPNMVIAIFSDRGNLFRDRYLGEKGKEDRRTPYYRSVLAFGHAALKQELRVRPLRSVSFIVTIRGGEGKILITRTVATDERGEAFVPLPPLEKIRLVEVETGPAVRKDILPPETIYVQPEELGRFNPLYVWFIQTQGLE